jgi:threonine/homoserine/homoserine lactone efflux protein
MALETWTAFAVASIALLLSPGPVVSQSLGPGRKSSPWCAIWRGALPRIGAAAMRRG